MLERHKNPEKQRWLPGARLNIAECALTGWDPDAPALLWAAEGSPDRLHSLTLDQLRRQCHAFAASLRRFGYRPGDDNYTKYSSQICRSVLGNMTVACICGYAERFRMYMPCESSCKMQGATVMGHRLVSWSSR